MQIWGDSTFKQEIIVSYQTIAQYGYEILSMD